MDATLPFSTVENKEFVKLLKLLQSRYRPVPRQTIQRKVIGEFKIIRTQIKNFICNEIFSKISLTLDGWSARTYRSYLVITKHWVDENWNMQSVLLDFFIISSPHDGENVCTIILEILKDCKIEERCVFITSDSGSEMFKGMKLLEKSLKKSGFHNRCIAHIINLSVQAACAEIQSSLSNLRNVINSIRISVKRRERFQELRNGLNL